MVALKVYLWAKLNSHLPFQTKSINEVNKLQSFMFKMSIQYGGVLPVYVGRNQRGGGILSSIARFILPTAKKMLTETVKAAPGVVDAIVNRKQSAGKAILGGLKEAGRSTAKDTLNRMGISNSHPAPKRRPVRRKAAVVKRRKVKHNDIFS
jgi:hypothetical protein